MKYTILRILKRIVNRLERNDSLISNGNMYGDRYIARELLNGGWVLWDKERDAGVDLNGYGGCGRFRWSTHSPFFKDCIGTRKEVHEAALELGAMAFKDEIQSPIIMNFRQSPHDEGTS